VALMIDDDVWRFKAARGDDGDGFPGRGWRARADSSRE
jgi:hypothetical protein